MCNNVSKKALEIVENICPYCKEHLTMNKRSFANHVRWCKMNPHYEEIRKSTVEKCTKANEIRFNNELGEIKKYKVVCSNPKCKKEFYVEEREKQFPMKEKYFCCRSCANSHERTEESKNLTSHKLIEYCRSVGKNIYGHEKRICANENCNNEFISRNSKHNFCCKKCAREQRARNEQIEKYKNIECEEQIKGFVFNLYKKQCKFDFSLNKFPNEFNFELIKENGWYKAKNHGDNLNGVSRDHMFSINQGFKEKINPYYISHPANCQLLLHSHNSSKHSKCSVTKEELIERVKQWNEKYGEYENKIDYILMRKCGLIFE